MTLVKNFKSTTVWNAFILNSIVTTLVIVFTLLAKDYADKHHKDKEYSVGVFASIIAAFLTSMLAYTVMYYAFGFGGGMLV